MTTWREVRVDDVVRDGRGREWRVTHKREDGFFGLKDVAGAKRHIVNPPLDSTVELVVQDPDAVLLALLSRVDKVELALEHERSLRDFPEVKGAVLIAHHVTSGRWSKGAGLALKTHAQFTHFVATGSGKADLGTPLREAHAEDHEANEIRRMTAPPDPRRYRGFAPHVHLLDGKHDEFDVVIGGRRLEELL